MDFDKLRKVLAGEPAFRLKQARQAVFRDLIEDWQKATVLPLPLRQKLAEECPLKIEAETLASADKKTIKALITFDDGLKAETVLMRYSDRNTVCVSSMVGCPLACEFCATGKMGFKRNLTTDEITEQVLFFNRYLSRLSGASPTGFPIKKENQKVNSIVFMGMGEPFLNYENVFEAIKVLNDKDKFNIGARHISISSVGIVEGIKKLSENPLQINLAISLHAAENVLRLEIMPINKKYPLEEILKAVEDYLEKTGRQVMFEYIMIKGVNDSLDQAQKLVELLSRFKKSLFVVNLILYNPTGIFSPSLPLNLKIFKEALEKDKIKVTERYRFGKDIKAACGQLAGK